MKAIAQPDRPSASDLVVHLVDDDEPLRRALTMLLEASGFAVQSHPSAEAMLAGLDADRVGCVVTDVRMPGMGGLDLQRTLLDRGVDAPLVVITGHGDVPMAVRALKAGAMDFLQKPFDDRAFLSAVAEALSRAKQTRGDRQAAAEARSRAQLLTPREREVMRLVVEGLGNQEIADQLGISVRTVEAHRAAVMLKMRASRVSDLVRMALRL